MTDFVRSGGELNLTNLGQAELLRAVTDRGVPLRTRVRGFSMSPFIRDNDILTIAPMNGCTPSIGEVVAFVQADTGRLVVHRVISRADPGWLVRGDNSPKDDGLITRENILGVVRCVEREGRDVRVGLGVERVLIALLQRVNALSHLVYIASRLWRIPYLSASNLPGD